MPSALFSLMFIGTVIVLSGGVIAAFALRSAPEGFEDENGFHGNPTKGRDDRYAGSGLPSSLS